ncbi:MAG: type II toxin-antitoxin system RelE/ParE family toxin [Leptospiraceae bacterium]|nr:type II toxin-antitoxin system RelE/ParE family toxin [Leptospiraceae bacterium]MCP5503110.1 type II toxin-antitoxin system RelE/ParE family toxin [Leptospiraceae bacterium]
MENENKKGESYRFEPEARKDLEDSFLWYEKQKKGLGLEFANEVFDTAEELGKKRRSTVEMHSNPSISSVKKTKLKRFPFSLYYVLKETLISIVAVWHDRRNPESLKNRK